MGKQVLVLQDNGLSLGVQNGLLAIYKRGRIIETVRPEEVGQVVLKDPVGLERSAISLLMREGIDTVLVSYHGRYECRLENARSLGPALRDVQTRYLWEPGAALALARQFIMAKVQNCRVMLRRTLKNNPDETVKSAVATMRRTLLRLDHARDLDELRGFEGAAAAAYFGCFPRLLANPDFVFHDRSRRPPRDPVNALLSFCYMSLLTRVHTAVCLANLDPTRGALHEPQKGRPSLALDLLEEYRPLVDREILTLINRKGIALHDFALQDDWTELDYAHGELPVRLAPSGQKKAHHLLGQLVGQTGSRLVEQKELGLEQ